MPGPWLLLAMALALSLTLTRVPGCQAQPEEEQPEEELFQEDQQEDQQEDETGAKFESLRQLLRSLLQRKDVQEMLGNPESPESEPEDFQSQELSKRQHPGKREEEAEEGVEEEKEEGGAVGPRKRQHPGPGENAATWPVDVALQKRQHPGRRLADPKAQRSWGEAEGGEGEEKRELTPEKRQHPGKRASGGPCGLRGDCGQTSLLLGLLDDLSRGRRAGEKRQHPGRRAAWRREPLEE